jgi:DNA-binding NtrC family response regulator
MGQTVTSRRVLLVDKERGWLAFGRTALTRAGYIVETAESASNAWDFLQKRDFDLVLIDLKEAEQEDTAVRQIAAFQSAKEYHVVIVFPTDLLPGKMRTMFRMGAYDCVDKQYDRARLLKLVEAQFAEIDRPALIEPEVWSHE